MRQTPDEHRHPWRLRFEPRVARLGGGRSTPSTIGPYEGRTLLDSCERLGTTGKPCQTTDQKIAHQG